MIVSLGDGYLVDPENPDLWQTLPLQPVKGVLVDVPLGVIVLWDFIRFVCIDREGVRWRTPSLSWDGFRDVEIVEGVVVASAWDASLNARRKLQIAIGDGTAIGGASPELVLRAKGTP